ncbi:MAG: hypothetical protein LBK98_10275 [Peptococcaceae bacterium]|jgi:hypothetical protein|nr:hypothetical protein [Peptococcaceae bacterium]
MNKEKRPLAAYAYARRIKIQLIVITALIAALAPIAVYDGEKYGVALGALAIAAGFALMIWQDSANKVLVYPEGLIQERGAGPLRRTVTIAWRDAACLKNDIGLGTFGRGFCLEDQQAPPVRIKVNSALTDYKELLELIITRSPKLALDRRTQATLKRMRVRTKKQ